MKTSHILFFFFVGFAKISSAQSDSNGTDSTAVEKIPSWEKTISYGSSVSYTLNLNAPLSTPKQSMSFTSALDITANYVPEKSRFHAANELHRMFTFGKADAKSRTLNSADQVQTLHDLSISFQKKGSWNINTIIKTESPLFSQFDGNFMKDYNQLGKIQAFLNPYRLTVSPGFKYQPSKALGISISPFSMELFGLTDHFIADKGQFIEERNIDGHYKTHIRNNLGAEANIWFTKKIKKRLEMSYKYNISSNYLEKLLKNGRMGGLFITKLYIIKGLALTHRATLKGDLSQIPFKPFYNQIVLLSYTVAL